MSDKISKMFSRRWHRSSRYNLGSDGFSIVELLITISMIGVISGTIIVIISNYMVTINRNTIITEMTSDSQNLLRSTVEELRYGAGVRQTNLIADSNTPGGWNTSNSNFVIIIAVPALDSSHNYIIDTATGAPYNNELVYFKLGTTLYKRILAHPSATGNTLRTTCPVASATPTCPADKKLSDYVKNMIFTLYDQDNISTLDPLLARSVKIDLVMERDNFGQPQVLNNRIQVTLRNNF